LQQQPTTIHPEQHMNRLLKFAWSISTLFLLSLVNAADTRINSGGAATGVWIDDGYFNTGNTYNTNAVIDTSLVANPAPTGRLSERGYSKGSRPWHRTPPLV
jgi:hypothetical protein